MSIWNVIKSMFSSVSPQTRNKIQSTIRKNKESFGPHYTALKRRVNMFPFCSQRLPMRIFNQYCNRTSNYIVD